jgi:hypothetical protein
VLPDQVLGEVAGSLRSILGGERTALNLLQHCSGIATSTRRHVRAARGKARIRDTRKTLPGLRGLEKAAVRAGGGFNHRESLSDAVLIKDNRENDELTFQVAAGEDFWLHAADYSGSHVIVRNPAREDELDENTLVRAAELAAYYSQARNSPKVEVHYTQRKFVKKPRRAKPGLVLLRQFRSLTVEPRNWAESERSG